MHRYYALCEQCHKANTYSGYHVCCPYALTQELPDRFWWNLVLNIIKNVMVFLLWQNNYHRNVLNVRDETQKCEGVKNKEQLFCCMNYRFPVFVCCNIISDRSLSPALLCSFACFTWRLLTDLEHKVEFFYCMKQINKYWMNPYAVWSIHVGICMMVKSVHVLRGK